MPTKISKRKLLLSLPIALISFEIYSGVLVGYLAGKFFGGKETGYPGRLRKSIIFNLGKYKLHVHHWVTGAGIIIATIILNLSFPYPQFSYGFLGGLVFHGIFSYSDWHKILIKKENA